MHALFAPAVLSSDQGVTVACSVRVVALLAAAILFYLLTAHTVYIRRSNFGRYLKQFAPFYSAVLAALLAELVIGSTKLVRPPPLTVSVLRSILSYERSTRPV